MKKVILKCEHRNITYKENRLGDIVKIFAVKCADCNMLMPDSYRRQIERHYNLPDYPLQVFPSKTDLIIYQHEKKQYQKVMKKYKN